jgi:type VI secretion system secreted protein VgrG
MVIANDPASHPSVPEQPALVYDDTKGGRRDELRVNSWEKVQGLVPGKVTLWDHCFEMPDKHLEAEKTIQKNVKVGQIVHPLSVPATNDLEVYDYPGLYAQRFDGVDRGGAPVPAELQKIFQDNERTAQIRMQEEAAAAVSVEGRSDSYFLTAGCKFTLQRHFNAEGDYVLTRVEHEATLGADYRSGGEGDQLKYTNRFTCIPLGLPFRPARTTTRPRIEGVQTATVVGPPGETVFCDKYGRVKVQFPWDREGKRNADSSCWVRVGTPVAGKRRGMIYLPLIGEEVIVDFLEGDPDRPIIVGSVFNAETMPPYELPENREVSGYKGRTGSNQLKIGDKAGSEFFMIHAEKNMNVEVMGEKLYTVVPNGAYELRVKQEIWLDSETDIKLTSGSSSLLLKADGTIELKGVKVSINASADLNAEAGAVHTVKGTLVKINC